MSLDDAVRRPIPAANDVTRTRRRNLAGIREEALPEGIGDEFGTRFGVAVGIVSAQAVVLDERATGAIVLIDLVARHHDNCARTRHRAHRLQHVCGSHHIGGEGPERIKIGRPHQRLGCHVDDDLGLAVRECARDHRPIGYVTVKIGASALRTESE
jgi:hypothetical protein